jgi:hypothetical protein
MGNREPHTVHVDVLSSSDLNNTRGSSKHSVGLRLDKVRYTLERCTKGENLL